MMSSALTTWKRPAETKLKLFNSLTRAKDVFEPIEPSHVGVKMYLCGPTVYDSAHMGHARAYVTFDVLRRVLERYFQYKTMFVMNITDIDDKIIKRAREQGCDFNELARKYENEFMDDMKSLNVLPPSELTRVTEYVAEIIEFTQKIIDNGYGYVAQDGSVYFNTVVFDNTSGHKYAKLVPEAFGGEDLEKYMKESEGELSVQGQMKKHPTDFALWKASKEGEPSWDSPWGKGRPGWHIECSAMCTKLCGDRLDIHAGGLDLKFPHHDNEIAQCEAYFDSDRWVNYFLHCGPLRIAGCKMSKSLKNFITIRKALETCTPRQLRILFLLCKWNDSLDYSDDSSERVIQFEKFVGEFFLRVKDIKRKNSDTPNMGAEEQAVREEFNKKRMEIDEALCDSVDTRTALEKLRELVGMGNVYIKAKDEAKAIPNSALLAEIAEYITWLFKVFGVVPDDVQMGYTSSDKEELVMPYLNSYASFREDVRRTAIGVKDFAELQKAVLKICQDLRKEELPKIGITADGLLTGELEQCKSDVVPYITSYLAFCEDIEKTTEEASDFKQLRGGILTICDRVRDDDLPKLGVRLEDKDGATCIKLVDPEELLREREQKEQLKEAKKNKQKKARR